MIINNIFPDKGLVKKPDFKSTSVKGITEYLRHLEVDKSFTMPKSARGGIYSIAQNIGITISTRKVDEDTIRVWRLE